MPCHLHDGFEPTRTHHPPQPQSGWWPSATTAPATPCCCRWGALPTASSGAGAGLAWGQQAHPAGLGAAGQWQRWPGAAGRGQPAQHARHPARLQHSRLPLLTPAAASCRPQFARLRFEGCSFLVAGRRGPDGRFNTLADIEMPPFLPKDVSGWLQAGLRGAHTLSPAASASASGCALLWSALLCIRQVSKRYLPSTVQGLFEEIPEQEFRADISSTELRALGYTAGARPPTARPG